MRAWVWLVLLGVLSLIFIPITAAILLLVLFPQACVAQSAGLTSAASTSTELTVVGDSITVMSGQALAHQFPSANVKALGGMPWAWGVDRVRELAAAKQLHPWLAFFMGTNAQRRATPEVTADDLRALVDAAPGVTDLVLMKNKMPTTTLYSYQGTNNTLFDQAQSIVNAEQSRLHRPSISVRVLDWPAMVAAHADWMGSDGIHPTPAGSAGIAQALAALMPAKQTATTVSAASGGRDANGVAVPTGLHHYTQAQMEAAVAKYDPAQAHILGAIAMAESSGYAFPSVNRTGVYHGPWQFQEKSNPTLDFHRLDTDLDYAAQQAANLAKTGITYGKWESYGPTGQGPYMKFMGGQSAGNAAAPQPNGGAVLAAANTSTSGCANNTAAYTTGAGGVASGFGWVFPLRTTQAAIKKGSQPVGGGWSTWCYTSLNNCHHDYAAADLMVPTGTPVLAPVDGTVVSTHTGLGSACVFDNRGDTMSFKGADGMAYFLGHMRTGSLTVRVGQSVKAGMQLGVVGLAAEGQCTVPHLHIQQNPAGSYGGQQNSINIQPVLVKLFAKLPAS